MFLLKGIEICLMVKRKCHRAALLHVHATGLQIYGCRNAMFMSRKAIILATSRSMPLQSQESHDFLIKDPYFVPQEQHAICYMLAPRYRTAMLRVEENPCCIAIFSLFY